MIKVCSTSIDCSLTLSTVRVVKRRREGGYTKLCTDSSYKIPIIPLSSVGDKCKGLTKLLGVL